MREMQQLTRAIEEMNRLLAAGEDDRNVWRKLCKDFADSSCDLIDIAYVPVGPGTWKERAESAETQLAAAKRRIEELEAERGHA